MGFNSAFKGLKREMSQTEVIEKIKTEFVQESFRVPSVS